MGGSTIKVKVGGVSKNVSLSVRKKIEVKSIACTTKLDEGSKNDGSGGVQDGMVFGKKYTFKVSEYVGGVTPGLIEKQSIIWEYTYLDSSGNSVVVNKTSIGDTLEIEVNDKEMCGKTMTVLAYVKQKECEGRFDGFCHYRFRHFDRKDFEAEVISRVSSPQLISQNKTSLCGIACIIFSFIQRNASDYQKFALELHRTGEASFNNYWIRPEKHFFKVSKDDSGYPSNWSGKMASADWIVMASIRNNENRSYDGKSGEDFDAINWPWVMTHLSKKFLGATIIKNETVSVRSLAADKTYELQAMQALINSGHKVMMMIDSDMISDKKSTFGFVNHWVSFVGPYTFDTSKSEHHFRIFTWGRWEDLELKKEIFNTNSYGFIAIK